MREPSRSGLAVLCGQVQLYNAILRALAKEYNFDLDTPFQDYPQKIHDILLHGTNGKEVRCIIPASAAVVCIQ